MTHSHSPEAPAGCTISVRTPRGRVFIRVEADALLKLGAAGDAFSMLATLDRHIHRLSEIALRRAERDGAYQVTLRAEDVWLPPAA
ncbi:MAG: hypothetical protein PGN26_11605 [Xylophilus ampelinus]